MSKQSTHLQPSYQRRAPGWVVRCKRCGFTEPWGKYAIRLHAASMKKCTIRRCPRCHRLCCHIIEKRNDKTTSP